MIQLCMRVDLLAFPNTMDQGMVDLIIKDSEKSLDDLL